MYRILFVQNVHFPIEVNFLIVYKQRGELDLVTFILGPQMSIFILRRILT